MFPRADAYALYGRLLNHFGEEDNAARAFQSGLGLMTSAAEELPVLDAPETLVGGDESKASGKPLKPSIEAESVVNPTTQ